jgi:hypothetical protein
MAFLEGNKSGYPPPIFSSDRRIIRDKMQGLNFDKPENCFGNIETIHRVENIEVQKNSKARLGKPRIEPSGKLF